MEKGFGGKILTGSFWIVGLELSNQALQFLKTFYAANVLTPKDFGIVGIAFLIIAFIEILSTTGMKEAIIQRKETDSSYLHTVYVIEFVKGSIVLILCLLFSFLIAPHVLSPDWSITGPMVIVIGIIFFLQCATNVGVLYFEKDIQFKQFFLYQFSGTLTDVVVSVVMVSYLQNVWGLFYGVIAGNAVKVLASFLLSRFRPSAKFSMIHARELYAFGRYIMRGRIFNFVGLQADSLIASTFFSLHVLGLYQMAFRIGNLPMSQVSNVIGRIAFPAFSRVHTERERLKEYFLTSLKLLIIGIAPLVLLVILLIDEFVMLFLGGEKWKQIVPIVQVLIVAGFLRIMISIVDTLFCSIAQPNVSSKLQFWRFCSFILLVAPLAYFFGILGVASAAMLSLLVVLAVFLRRALRELCIDRREIFGSILEPVMFGVSIGLITFLFKSLLNLTELPTFLLVALFLISSYVGIGWLLEKYSKIKVFDKAFFVLRLLQKKYEHPG